MKKNLFIIFIYIFGVSFFLLYNQIIKLEIKNITSIFIENYIPCLLPFSLLNLLILNKINFSSLYSYFSNKKINFIFDILIIFICVICGIPGSSILLKKLSYFNIYNKEKINRILTNYGTISLPFIYSITNKNLPFILILIIVESISYLLTKKELISSYYKDEISTISLKNYILSSFSTIYMFLVICIIISIPIKIITNSKFLFLLLGFFETSFPCITLIETNNYLFTYFLLSFTSFSLIYPLKKSIIYYPIKTHIK